MWVLSWGFVCKSHTDPTLTAIKSWFPTSDQCCDFHIFKSLPIKSLVWAEQENPGHEIGKRIGVSFNRISVNLFWQVLQKYFCLPITLLLKLAIQIYFGVPVLDLSCHLALDTLLFHTLQLLVPCDQNIPASYSVDCSYFISWTVFGQVVSSTWQPWFPPFGFWRWRCSNCEQVISPKALQHPLFSPPQPPVVTQPAMARYVHCTTPSTATFLTFYQAGLNLSQDFLTLKVLWFWLSLYSFVV